MLNSGKKKYQANPAAASEFLSVGEKAVEGDYDLPELAAYAQVASAIFNLDETITKY